MKTTESTLNRRTLLGRSLLAGAAGALLTEDKAFAAPASARISAPSSGPLISVSDGKNGLRRRPARFVDTPTRAS